MSFTQAFEVSLLMRQPKSNQQIEPRISEERPLNFPRRLRPVKRGEMLAREEICNGRSGEHVSSKDTAPPHNPRNLRTRSLK
jgi:hypothetical protein